MWDGLTIYCSWRTLSNYFSSTPWLMLIVCIYNGLFFVNNKVIFFRTLRIIHLPLGFSSHLSAYLSAYAGWAPLNKDLSHTETSSQHWRVTHKLSWHVIWNLTHKAPWDYIDPHIPTQCYKEPHCMYKKCHSVPVFIFQTPICLLQCHLPCYVGTFCSKRVEVAPLTQYVTYWSPSRLE